MTEKPRVGEPTDDYRAGSVWLPDANVCVIDDSGIEPVLPPVAAARDLPALARRRRR